MDKISYYKNFSMGTEIDIAGRFIYNGIKDFNKLKTFSFESEIFHVLYSISVGIERLQKVLIVLLEDISIDDIDDFEESLKTHSHQDLHNRINKNYQIELNSHQNSLLQLITNFYKECRYIRFNFNSDHSKEKNLFIKFLSENLKIDILVDQFLTSTYNNDRIKNFFGRVVGSISKKYYHMIEEVARKLNIYTYELRSDSPAAKIFLPDFKKNSLQEQYINEQVSLKEFLVFLMNTKETSAQHEFIKSIEPLKIDIALEQEYLSDICCGKISQSLIDEIEFLYEEEVSDVKNRLLIMNVIGNMNCIFDEEYEDEDEE